MKTIVALSLTAMLGATPAFAADLPTYKPAPNFPPLLPPFSWTGYYVGVNGGYGWGSTAAGGGGGVVGGTLGYNYQIDQFVIGAEADLDFASVDGKASYPPSIYLKSRLDSLTTERLRLGYAMDRTLFYVTGGYAGGDLHGSLSDGPNGLYGSKDSWRSGYAIGGGVEYAFTNHISAKAEYLYAHLGSQTIYAGPEAGRSSSNTSLFRVGLNYRF